MSDDELKDALMGLFAYDTGSVDSGIHDEVLRERVIGLLHKMDEEEFRLKMSRFVRDWFLTEEALAQRYGIEDVKDFIEWLGDWMQYDV